MTELNLAAPPAPTMLAGFLSSAVPQPLSAVYLGVLTPVELDARPSEIEALVSAAAVHDLGWLRRVSVRGKDRFRWLSGMVTNMVKDLTPDTGAWNLVLNAQGRVQGDLAVWRQPPQRQEPVSTTPRNETSSLGTPVAGEPRENDDLELELTAVQADKLLPHLDRFIIMDDVEFVPLEGETAVGLTGPKAAEVLARLGLPAPPEPFQQARAEWNGIQLLVRRLYGILSGHYALWVPAAQAADLWQALAAAGAHPVGSAALEAFRIAEGIPLYGVDMTERDLPLETSQMRALHFDKGCYIGQEIVERIRSRGNVHRHLRSLELAGPLPEAGTQVSLEGAEAGYITSAAELPLGGQTRIFAIGMIRGDAEARNLPLNYSVGETSGSASILPDLPPLVPGVER